MTVRKSGSFEYNTFLLKQNLYCYSILSGDTYASQEANFRICRPMIGKIMVEVCEAIGTVFAKHYIQLPQTHDDWREAAKRFKDRWNLDNCIGTYTFL